MNRPAIGLVLKVAERSIITLIMVATGFVIGSVIVRAM